MRIPQKSPQKYETDLITRVDLRSCSSCSRRRRSVCNDLLKDLGVRLVMHFIRATGKLGDFAAHTNSEPFLLGHEAGVLEFGVDLDVQQISLVTFTEPVEGWESPNRVGNEQQRREKGSQGEQRVVA